MRAAQVCVEVERSATRQRDGVLGLRDPEAAVRLWACRGCEAREDSLRAARARELQLQERIAYLEDRLFATKLEPAKATVAFPRPAPSVQAPTTPRESPAFPPWITSVIGGGHASMRAVRARK